MANPFENADGTYLVLVNEEGQYSLWPGFIDVPSGWTVVHEQKGREASLKDPETTMRLRLALRMQRLIS